MAKSHGAATFRWPPPLSLPFRAYFERPSYEGGRVDFELHPLHDRSSIIPFARCQNDWRQTLRRGECVGVAVAVHDGFNYAIHASKMPFRSGRGEASAWPSQPLVGENILAISHRRMGRGVSLPAKASNRFVNPTTRTTRLPSYAASAVSTTSSGAACRSNRPARPGTPDSS